VIKTVRGAVGLTGVGRVIAHRRVVVGLALTGFSLHDAHGPPIDESVPYTLRWTSCLSEQHLLEPRTTPSMMHGTFSTAEAWKMPAFVSSKAHGTETSGGTRAFFGLRPGTGGR
jgi:hypothetical protein